ncbi:MAG: hypothetical protein OES38_19170, partial [Gammaproteobacteria bacterium]|nr:hypothetical protein [Gammaproteobacteria bacterium]
EIKIFDLDGTQVSSFSTTAFGSAVPTGVAFIGTTTGGVYDDHLAISDPNLDMVLLVTQAGTLVSSFDTSSFSLRTNDLAHIPGSDKLLLIDRDAVVITTDFAGTDLGQYDVAPFGTTVPEAIAINTVTCDHVAGDDTPDLVVTLNQTGGGGLSGTFLDEFNAIAYNGSDGTLDWTNDWQETGESDGPGSGYFSVVTSSWCASGNCLQIREDLASTRRLDREVDMAGAVTATLSLNYRRRHVSTPIGGTITLEISDDGGANFTPLKIYDMGTQDAGQQTDSFDITAYISPNTQIRFSTSNVLFETALYVDNVLIDTTGGGGGGPSGPASYVEMHQPWTASTPDIWENAELGTFGVPPNAVIEVAVINSSISAQRWGGVRAVGSSLDRRLLLHEAEAGGADAVTMHVQANGSSQIQHYSDNTGQISFVLLGYWTGAAYVESFSTFKAGGSDSWLEHNLGAYGVGPNQVAEIAVVNTSTSNERLAGVRPSGATYERLISLHEAESGGVDALSIMVETDASSIAEVYAASNTDIDFYVVGYWSTPPGTYTEATNAHGSVSSPATWEPADLTTFGVPAGAVAQFIITNDGDTAEQNMGVREMGSSLGRLLDLQEAEAGGSDAGTMHANVDGSSQVQWYAESGTTDRFFYPIGWWVIP